MRPEIDETLLTAYALGELDARERGRVAAHVEADADARRYVEEIRETAGLITDHLGLEPADGLTALQHEVIERRLRQFEGAAAVAPANPMRIGSARRLRLRQWLPLAASLAASIAIVCGSLAVLLPWMYPRPAITRDDGRDASWQLIRPGGNPTPGTNLPGESPDFYAEKRGATNAIPENESLADDGSEMAIHDDDWEAVEGMRDPRSIAPRDAIAHQDPASAVAAPAPPAPAPAPNQPDRVASAGGDSPAPAGDAEDLRTGGSGKPGPAPSGSPGSAAIRPRESTSVSLPDPAVFPEILKNSAGGDDAPKVYENPFRLATQRPRSAFPVRVETTSYKAVRRSLLERQLPPAHVVRIEELVNRFRYDYAPPADHDAALAASVEISACPWNVAHRLARVAIKAREGGAAVVARGVEVGVEFNPLATAQWRLIGYENAPAAPTQPSALAASLAAAGTATAFYEIVPVAGLDPRVAARTELFTLNVRYRDPADNAPHKFELAALDPGQGFDRATHDFRFAASVAAFGMLLRDSQFKGAATYADVIRWANSARGPTENPERAAFVDLARFARDAARAQE